MDKKSFTIVATDADEGLRLDRWLAKATEISSRSRAAELIDRGLVRSGAASLKASTKVRSGMIVQVEIPAAPSGVLIAREGDLNILFEDEDVVVVDKPVGLVVHPAPGHSDDTLVNLLLHHVKDLSMGFQENRPGIVHRIDRDTSGLLVIAKNDQAHHSLAAQFKAKSTNRTYWAITGAAPVPAQGVRKSYLARHPTDRKKFASTTKPGLGKLAITHYRTLATSGKASWVECRLETGRTHQIRVHLSELGAPILGDPIYGGKFKNSAPRLMLHAMELGFTHPRSGERLNFRSPWPELGLKTLRELGFKP